VLLYHQNKQVRMSLSEYNPANENGLKWIENFNPF